MNKSISQSRSAGLAKRPISNSGAIKLIAAILCFWLLFLSLDSCSAKRTSSKIDRPSAKIYLQRNEEAEISLRPDQWSVEITVYRGSYYKIDPPKNGWVEVLFSDGFLDRIEHGEPPHDWGHRRGIFRLRGNGRTIVANSDAKF